MSTQKASSILSIILKISGIVLILVILNYLGIFDSVKNYLHDKKIIKQETPKEINFPELNREVERIINQLGKKCDRCTQVIEVGDKLDPLFGKVKIFWVTCENIESQFKQTYTLKEQYTVNPGGQNMTYIFYGWVQ